ncbi:MAG: Fe-S cluster assembly ATPase SufC [Acidimicrobiales bacterium]
MLLIDDLHTAIGDKAILQGLTLEVPAGEVHAVMGPNGSGKSTLAHVLAGREPHLVTSGRVLYDGQDLLEMTPETRAAAGVFLAFQHPVEIPGVSNMYFLRTALNAIRRARGMAEVAPAEFLKMINEKIGLVGIDRELMGRSVNEGFSGGEKKRNEILQMAVLAPRLAILDETDSGLDIDALRVVSGGVEALRGPERAIVLITHHQRLLDYVVPDKVHVLAGGRIVASGGPELAVELEEHGYSGLDGTGGLDETGGSDGSEPSLAAKGQPGRAPVGTVQ